MHTFHIIIALKRELQIIVAALAILAVDEKIISEYHGILLCTFILFS